MAASRPQPFETIEIPLYPDETSEDLQRGGLRLIQKKQGFRYGEVAVVLAHYAAAHWRSNRRKEPFFVELGSQCGVVSILLAALSPRAKGIGLELIERQVEVMSRNIALNRLEDRLSTVQGDIRKLARPNRNLPGNLVNHSVDMVVCNPPFGVPCRSLPRRVNLEYEYENFVAREEIACNFGEICRLAARLLKTRGRFIFAHRPDRLPELFAELHRHQLMPVELLPIMPHFGDRPSTLMIVAIRNGKPGSFNFMPPLIVRTQQGQYTRQMSEFIGEPEMYRPSPGDPILVLQS
ncbi:MAG TPA: methyltransferase [Clostridiaceae bacterium]|nr:methyltransferase [Clostridiaceae bacterium]